MYLNIRKTSIEPRVNLISLHCSVNVKYCILLSQSNYYSWFRFPIITSRRVVDVI